MDQVIAGASLLHIQNSESELSNFRLNSLTECVCFSDLYSQPRFITHMNSTVTVQFETEGFLKPEVIWLGEHNQKLSYHLELHDKREDGLLLHKEQL